MDLTPKDRVFRGKATMHTCVIKFYILYHFEQKDEWCHDSEDFNSQQKLTPIETFIEKASSYGLPKYIQNMLVACHYDRLETVAKMSIDQSSPGQINDIDNIELLKPN